MKKPYEIHSDFFQKMIASGWYENREIILDSLPHHLEELPDNVKKILREIWCLTISYEAYYRSNGRIFLSTVLHNFGETTSWSNTASPTDWCFATNKTVTIPTAKCSKAATTQVKNGRSTTAKTIPSLPTLTIRQLRPLGTGMQLDQRRRRKRPTSPLLPLRPNRHTIRDCRRYRSSLMVWRIHRLGHLLTVARFF